MLVHLILLCSTKLISNVHRLRCYKLTIQIVQVMFVTSKFKNVAPKTPKRDQIVQNVKISESKYPLKNNLSPLRNARFPLT